MENFGIKDIVDILLVALIMYQLYYLVKKSGTTTIFKGIFAFLILWIVVSHVLQMRLLGAILSQFVSIGMFVIIILFQDEIRRFLMSLGSNNTFRLLAKFFGSKNENNVTNTVITPLVLACMNMAKTYTGALIVVEGEMSLGHYSQTGETINADVSTRLIENIFFKNSPLHDGAMIISAERIKAAGCILPVSQDPNIPKQFGLRHRAGLGISQETDAQVIIVSEERGRISYMKGGHIHPNITAEKLQELLSEPLTKKRVKAEKDH
ncbi:diadenylate cyclase CdaA [Dysgonomonas macrotermitis]|uniref:Diadenylate cyclase n=1 Tax=Dysgonomonas macrotermitis TaxID=1346286 RepID=A0A1M5G8T0_9BACT|nr:diadenylate cyclase CdaA [Dysgonomonas macrotermitis]SHF99861.1 TIGR00159 family protein [Dysgonomonas macrotermitis]